MLAPWKSGRHDCGPVKLLSHLLQLARTHRPRTTPKRAGNRVLPAASRPSLVAIACVGTHLVHTLGRTLARINLRRRRGVRACKAAAGDSFVSEKTKETRETLSFVARLCCAISGKWRIHCRIYGRGNRTRYGWWKCLMDEACGFWCSGGWLVVKVDGSGRYWCCDIFISISYDFIRVYVVM